MKKIWDLPRKDKSLHRHLSFARTQLQKVASLIREKKADSPEWQKHADEAEGASKCIETWMQEIRKDGEI